MGALASLVPGLTSKAWAPEVAGAVIGLLQIPSYLLADVALGTSSSYMWLVHLVGTWVSPKLTERHPVLKTYNTAKDLYQVGLVTGVILGARLSLLASGVAVNADAVSISPLASFAGGILLVLGARIAGGCTSGHGISGIARLSVSSLVSTAAMFAGAIGFGLLFMA